MDEQRYLQEIMHAKLMDFRSRNHRFSIRAYAKRLGLHPSATNEILKGQRRVSRKIAEKIAKQLNLDPQEIKNLVERFPKKASRNKREKESSPILEIQSVPNNDFRAELKQESDTLLN